jgi:hypothetical protein
MLVLNRTSCVTKEFNARHRDSRSRADCATSAAVCHRFCGAGTNAQDTLSNCFGATLSTSAAGPVTSIHLQTVSDLISGSRSALSDNSNVGKVFRNLWLVCHIWLASTLKVTRPKITPWNPTPWRHVRAAFNYSEPSSGKRHESVFESFYRPRVTQSIDLSPDVEVSIHPTYATRAYTTTLLSVRMRIIFYGPTRAGSELPPERGPC